MHILVTNDDGYLSKGIAELASAMENFGKVSVFAPEVDKSGSSNSLTLDRPLRVKESVNGFYYINGTPTDCVHLAATTLLECPPDFVVSGINCGRNVADDVHYSGTVAAAMEGFMLNIPSIAFSLDSVNYKNIPTAVEVVKMTMSKIVNKSISLPFLLNVNVPDVPLKDFRGCSGVIVGSPTRFGNMCAEMKYFIDQSLDNWISGDLIGKPAGFFTSTSSMHGGQESTLTSMMLPFLHHGMVIVGIPYCEKELSSTKSGGTPYGASHVSFNNKKASLTREEDQLAKALGRRISKMAIKLA